MPQPYVDHYAEPNAEAYTKAYAKKHVEQDPIPDIEPYNRTPPRSQPDEPLSPLSRAQPSSLSRLFSYPSSPSYTPASLPIRPQPEAPYVEPDHAEPLCFDEYGRSCTLADLYKNVRPPTSSRVSQPAELATIEVELSEPVMEKFKPVRVLGLRKFWTVEALHFPVNINGRSMDCLLDSSSEVNVLPYVTALSPGFRIFSDVRDDAMVDIKGAPFCGYMPDVPVQIGSVEVRLPFFISRKARQCTLGRPFEAATEMMRVTKNDGSVRMVVFNDQGDYTVFQLYTPGDGDQYGYKTVWRESRNEEKD